MCERSWAQRGGHPYIPPLPVHEWANCGCPWCLPIVILHDVWGLTCCGCFSIKSLWKGSLSNVEHDLHPRYWKADQFRCFCLTPKDFVADTDSLALSAQHFLSDVNQACADGALMFKRSCWWMKAVGGRRFWFHLRSLSVSLRCSFPSVSLPANSSSLAQTHPKAAQTEQWRRLGCVRACVLGGGGGGGDLTLKKMEEQVSLFKSAWHPKSSLEEACSSFCSKNSALSGVLLIFMLLLQRQERVRQVWPFRLQEMSI